MPRNRYVLWGGILGFLILANVVYSIYSSWGLITVKVTEAPLSKVIKSIEWQGWVKIYTNLPPDTAVTMSVDHVPLAEAMETLAANANPPPRERPDRPQGQDGQPPAGGDRPAGAPPSAPGNVAAGGPPGGGANGGPERQGRNGGGGRGGRSGGGFGGGLGGGGGFGGTQWNLAFFVAPTSAEVKDEIRAFEAGTTDDDTKVYTFSTPLQMIASDAEMPASDPRYQAWPGVRPTPPTPPPAPAADGTTPPADAPAPDPLAPAQGYLKGFAESANIWIMAPGSWAPNVTADPPPNSSIISAIKNFVSSARGSVTTAIILRSGRGGGGRGQRGGGGFADMDATADRIRNAINGLPEENRGDALAQLDQEVKFFHDVKLAPPEDQPKMIQEHMRAKMGNNNNWRKSPEGRAKMYQRMVNNRETAQGKK